MLDEVAKRVTASFEDHVGSPIVNRMASELDKKIEEEGDYGNENNNMVIPITILILRLWRVLLPKIMLE